MCNNRIDSVFYQACFLQIAYFFQPYEWNHKTRSYVYTICSQLPPLSHQKMCVNRWWRHYHTHLVQVHVKVKSVPLYTDASSKLIWWVLDVFILPTNDRTTKKNFLLSVCWTVADLLLNLDQDSRLCKFVSLPHICSFILLWSDIVFQKVESSCWLFWPSRQIIFTQYNL